MKTTQFKKSIATLKSEQLNKLLNSKQLETIIGGPNTHRGTENMATPY